MNTNQDDYDEALKYFDDYYWCISTNIITKTLYTSFDEAKVIVAIFNAL